MIFIFSKTRLLHQSFPVGKLYSHMVLIVRGLQKRPVKFSFLDFTTLAQLEFFCRKELRLNQRFAPHLYIDVCPIVRRGTKLQMNGAGEAVEFPVRMRQVMPRRHACGRSPAKSAIADSDARAVRFWQELAGRAAQSVRPPCPQRRAHGDCRCEFLATAGTVTNC